MGDKTAISWTDATWNPTVGCSVVSPGCTNCYAMGWASRMLDKPGSHYDGTTKVVNGKAVWTGLVREAPEAILLQPLRWKRPRKIFVDSMSDLFHPSMPWETVDKVMAVMGLAPQHTYQILTKRSDRQAAYMAEFVAGKRNVSGAAMKIRDSVVGGILVSKLMANATAEEGQPFSIKPFDHVYMGVSVEDEARKARIFDLQDTPAALRFLSIEPQVGDVGKLDLRGIGWVIVGGESGPDARPFHMEWAVDIQIQCAEAKVPFFMKQAGSNAFVHGRPAGYKDRKGQDMSEWPLRVQFQNSPERKAAP